MLLNDSILFRPATDCVLLESQLANGLRPSFAQPVGKVVCFLSIFTSVFTYRSKSLKNILKLSSIIPFKSVSYKPIKGKQQLEDKRITLGGVASDLMKTIRWISYKSRGMLTFNIPRDSCPLCQVGGEPGCIK